MNEKTLPDKLFVNVKDFDGGDQSATATAKLPESGKDGDTIVVYRKVYTRKLRVRTNLALRAN